ncbi:MAG: ribonuclease E/G [Bauldia sp.]|nr:ribonuclease E/G [Bauldia sp.]MCW5716695.1 ribonuclease E/G [Bauldia sp.]
MPNKMLIDAAHPEETRVVVVRGNRVEEFDFESAQRKQLRGNIYLAKVTRVEPSLQAAFVEYGGNRHGFLAFSEIHPDYYQIPVADRQALIEAEEREAAAEEAEARAAEAEAARTRAVDAASDAVAGEVAAEDEDGHEEAPPSADGDHDDLAPPPAPTAPHDERPESDEEHPEDVVESVGAEDAMEEVPERRKTRARQYKIQEVIRRRQVILVQVVKEERGTKGAALTTYLSLAGRYSVLMPNTSRGGGISRKITSPADRKRLKSITQDLEVPEGMGVILRTAGASRTKAEVKRDFEYLLRLWESVRELTLRSTAPALVYEEGSLIKRSIRDLYGKDIEEVLVAGDEGYREAKDFMRMLMPSHAKSVQPYKESQPLFARHGIEPQLDAMFSPHVPLPSGGYIVINQTEALVSIDVNSGRSTREHNIEDTAHQTNLEASDEVARQLRLRDLAGLIVIDYIDMEERRNNRSVERRIKEALKDDRARIQVGRISHFGLLEMSRQRIRTGVLESTTEVCPHCMGTGHVRSPASVSLHVLRSIEDHLLKSASHNLIIRTRTNVALYILNQKRSHLSALEAQFGLTITITADETVNTAAHFVLERGDLVTVRPPLPTSIQPTSVQPGEETIEAEPEILEIEEENDEDAEEREEGGEDRPRQEGRAADDGERRRKRRRRRRRGGGEGREQQAGEPAEPTEDGGDESHRDVELVAEGIADNAGPAGGDDEGEGTADGEGDGSGVGADGQPRRRRRGRRGGRRSRRPDGEMSASDETASGETETATVVDEAEGTGHQDAVSQSYAIAAELGGEVPVEVSSPEMTDEQPPVRHDEVRVEEAASASRRDEVLPAEPATDTTPPPEPEPSQPKRGGWWQRRSFF